MSFLLHDNSFMLYSNTYLISEIHFRNMSSSEGRSSRRSGDGRSSRHSESRNVNTLSVMYDKPKVPIPGPTNVNTVHGKQFPHVYVDGLAAVGKTTLMRSLAAKQFNVLLLDFAENIERFPEFKHKHKNPILGILYSIFHFKNILTQPPSIVDRSPCSDIWYSGIFGLMSGAMSMVEISNIFESPLFRNLMKNFTTIFFSVDYEDKLAIDTIVKAMKDRNNKLDIVTEEYVRTQIAVFDLLRTKNIQNFFFWVKPIDMPIYSREYAEAQTTEVLNLLDCVQKRL